MSEPRQVLLYTREPDASAQLWRLRSYALEQEWQVVGEFAETTQIGSRRARPEFRRLIEVVKSGAVAGGLVLSPALSTIFDSLPQLVSTVDELRVRSVGLVTLATSTEIDEEFRLSVSALVQFQQELVGRRIRHGLDEARRQGKRIGRARVEVPVGRARALLAEGKGLRETARVLGVAPSTLHRKLKAGDGVAA